VVRVELPPLRARPDDIPRLVEHLLDQLGTPPEVRAAVFPPSAIHALRSSAWPGNVRELRNHLERAVVLRRPPTAAAGASPVPVPINLSVPYHEARRQLVAPWEHAYVHALLAAHKGKVAVAARAAGVAPSYLYKLLARVGAARGLPEDTEES
jgi:DNA-binding NtrC family response regulator